MFAHLLRLMWNQKRRHLLLIVEILASFLVLFGVSALILHSWRNYREPLGFDYRNVWVFDMDARAESDSTAAPKMQWLKAKAKSFPEVESVSLFGFNSPFSNNTSNRDAYYKSAHTETNHFTTDPEIIKTLGLTVVEGRWFTKADEVEGLQPVVINQALREKLFGTENPLGKRIAFNDEGKMGDARSQVVGVVGNFKSDGEYRANKPALFELAHGKTGTWMRKLIVKVKPGTDARVEAQLVREFGAITKDWNADVSYMEDQRKNTHSITLIPIAIFLIVVTFLLINVALGLFGVLNVSIAKRRGEIGLRRALGATETAISWQFVGEIWALATFALILGLLLAGQFPLLSVFDLDAGVYLLAMGISVIVIYLLVTICALYPGLQAARLQPAVALHED